MKGTDVTPEQLQSAREFIAARRIGSEMGQILGDDQLLSVRFGDVARLLAWYGALRFLAGKSGMGGSLESPGPMEVVARKVFDNG
jgi:hypothetical protein